MNKGFREICTAMVMFGFLLGIRGDRVALWRDGEPHPQQIYDIPVRSLPAQYRAQLEQGIRVETKEELWILLEKFF